MMCRDDEDLCESLGVALIGEKNERKLTEMVWSYATNVQNLVIVVQRDGDVLQLIVERRHLKPRDGEK